MSKAFAFVARQASEALFSVLPRLPYAPTEKAGCPGLAVSARHLTAAGRTDEAATWHWRAAGESRRLGIALNEGLAPGTISVEP